MAKMGNGTGLRKIALSQIVDTGNVRVDYSEIAELAESIKKHGQLEPVLVKALEPDADGIERFELVAGHRRRLAFQKLIEAGESFTNIDAVVVTGDKLTLQLVENLQRNDLTAPERESGIFQMCKSGLSQKEVAARLSKPETYVSRNVSAYKIREAARAAGIDVSDVATAVLNEIQAAKAADYPALVKAILQNGGTLIAARGVMEEYRISHGKPANPQREKGKAAEIGGGLTDPLSLHPSPAVDPIAEEFSEQGVDVDIDINTEIETDAPEPLKHEKPQKKPDSKKPVATGGRDWLNDFDPPHKQVDFNTVCLCIMRYGKELQKTITSCSKFNNDCHLCGEKCEAFLGLAATERILALLHSEL